MIAGTFAGTINFGGQLLAANAGDVFVARFDPAGAHMWSKSFGTTNNQNARAVDVDATGNIYLAGYFFDSLSLGGATMTSAGNNDMFVGKLDANGSHMWSRRIGTSAVGEQIDHISTTADAGVVIVADFANAMDFGTGTLQPGSGTNIALAKYAANGTPQWSKALLSSGSAQTGSLAVVNGGSDGTIAIAGRRNSGTIDLGGGVSLTSGTRYVGALDSNGTGKWVRDLAAASPAGVSVGPDGAVVLAGYFSNTLNLGGNDLMSAGGTDVFVAKYDGDGNHIWSKRYGVGLDDSAFAVTTDGAGNIILSGWFEGGIDFGGGNLASMGSQDMFIAKLAPDGTHLWSLRAGNSMAQTLSPQLDASPNSGIVVGGFFTGTFDLGGPTLICNGALQDVFAAGLQL